MLLFALQNKQPPQAIPAKRGNSPWHLYSHWFLAVFQDSINNSFRTCLCNSINKTIAEIYIYGVFSFVFSLAHGHIDHHFSDKRKYLFKSFLLYESSIKWGDSYVCQCDKEIWSMFVIKLSPTEFCFLFILVKQQNI